MTETSRPHDLPPQVVILDMLLGMMKTQAIHEAVRLNLAERLKDGPKKVSELAAETETHENSLTRLLRALESLGLFQETTPGSYAQTPLSHFLRPQVMGSMYDVALIHGEQWQWRPWEAFNYSLRTGETAFDRLFETPLFSYFSTHPQEGEGFNRAMAGFSHQVDQPLVEGYDYSALSTIVDVGGGYGGWLTTILQAHPRLQGVLFDLPPVIADARQQGSTSATDGRLHYVAGDMFQADTMPQGDAYILRQIVKDWDDEAAVRILTNCRRAMRPGGKILVAEQIVRPGAGVMVPTKLIDLQLMVVLSGQERTEDEYRKLFEAAGLQLAKIWPTRSLYSIMEGVSA
jgi:SAM-dependent methyltransferase/DNA-binding HxlR family transcriptional regulator